MDNRNRKNRSEPPQPVKNNSALKWTLGASLAANVALGVLLLRSPGEAHTQPGKGNEASASTMPTPAASSVPRASGDPVFPRELRSYAALGTFVAENNKIPALRWTPPQFEAFQAGMRSSYEGRGFAVDEDAVKLRDEISAKVQAIVGATKANPVEEYFSTLREKEGVQKSESNLHYRITDQGHGAKPTPESTIVVSYTARLPNGQGLNSLSRPRVRSAVADLLPGLAEGVQLINAGGKALVYLPPELSFRDGPWPEGVPQGAPIIFFVELHEVVDE